MTAPVISVRKPPTKYTPKWALTTDGIVRWWERNRAWVSDIAALRLTERLLRLFAVGCCRSPIFWGNADDDVRDTLTVLECAADATQSLLTLSYDHKRDFHLTTKRSITLAAANFGSMPGGVLAESGCSMVAYCTARMTAHGDDVIDGKQVVQTEGYIAEHVRQGRLLAGIAGPDWSLSEEWRMPTAVALASGIYKDHAFDRMPILADALQDAGCDNEPWLARMRDPSWPWCRGCHILDSLLPELVSV